MTEKEGDKGTKTSQSASSRNFQKIGPVIPLPEYYETLSSPGKRRARKARQKQIANAKARDFEQKAHSFERLVQSKGNRGDGSSHHRHACWQFYSCGHAYRTRSFRCRSLRYYPRSKNFLITIHHDNNWHAEVLLMFLSKRCYHDRCVSSDPQTRESAGERYQRIYAVSEEIWNEFINEEMLAGMFTFFDLWDREKEYRKGLLNQKLQGWNESSMWSSNFAKALLELDEPSFGLLGYPKRVLSWSDFRL
jgi:hypothetical protein